MEKDFKQKEQLAKLFWSWGFLCDFNVKVWDPRSGGYVKTELTDLDVLGRKINRSLYEERACGDCKTLKNMSIINRAFWQRGIMDYLRISRGYIVARKQSSESHRQTARDMGITLLDDKTFDIYCQNLGMLEGLDKMNMFKRQCWDNYEKNIPSRQSLNSLLSYRDYGYWTDKPNRSLRLTLMEMASARGEMDENHKHHRALALDCSTRFASSLLSMIAELFQIHAVTDDKKLLDDYLKKYIYGGKEIYDHLNIITKKLIELKRDQTLFNEKNIQHQPTDLSLPDWGKFIQLYRTLIAAPVVALEIPRVLRFALFERILYNNESVTIAQAIPDISSHTVKLATDVVTYFLNGSQLFSKFGKDVVSILDELLLSLKKISK